MSENELNKDCDAKEGCECCGCGHDCEDDGYETLTLSADDGTETECVVLGVFDAMENEYIALLPMEEEEVLLFRYTEDGEDDDNITLSSIESDEEFDAVSKVYYEIFEADEDDEEEEDGGEEE